MLCVEFDIYVHVKDFSWFITVWYIRILFIVAVYGVVKKKPSLKPLVLVQNKILLLLSGSTQIQFTTPIFKEFKLLNTIKIIYC